MTKPTTRNVWGSAASTPGVAQDHALRRKSERARSRRATCRGTDPGAMTAEQRLQELGSILAAVNRRLRVRNIRVDGRAVDERSCTPVNDPRSGRTEEST